MKTRKYSSLWRLASLVMTLSLVLAACAAPTPAPTAAPTEAPTEAPTAAPTAAPAVTTVIQDFESSPKVYDGNQAKASTGDVAYNGAASLKSASDSGEWHTVGVDLGSVDVSPFEKLCYYVYDTTANNDGSANNTVGVKLYDASGASIERYTDNEGVGSNPKTHKDAWTLMCMNLISFTGIDQTKVSKIEFTMYWAGTYYFDDLTLLAHGDELTLKPQTTSNAPASVLAQGFEADGTFYTDYQADVSLATDIFHSGKSSLKILGGDGNWHSGGGYPDTRPFDASKFDQVCYWVYDSTKNDKGETAGNTISFSLIDTAGTKDEVWSDNADAGTNPKTAADTWVQICLKLSAFKKADLTKIDKLQYSMYWGGAYYVDDIEFVSGGAAAAPTTTLAQGFEADGTFYSDYQADVSLATDIFHSGKSSLKILGGDGNWHAGGGYPDPRPFDASKYDKVCYWIYDDTKNDKGEAAGNTVSFSLIDTAGTKDEVWSDNADAGTNPKTAANTWVQICLKMSAFTKADLTKIDKLQYSMYWGGAYYVDDIEFVSGGGAAAPAGEPVLGQGFEADGTFYSDYQADVSLATDIFHGGKSSLKILGGDGNWHAGGGYPDPRPFDASKFSKVCYWIYDNTKNDKGEAAGNTVSFSLIDTAGTKDEVWSDNADAGTNPKTAANTWVQICLNMSAFTKADLTKIDKLQYSMYWGGDYYVDDIEFVP